MIYGELPSTVEQITGGGGRHLFFKHPAATVKNKVSLVSGIDIRGDGGYIVVAPSRHASGNLYRWKPGHGPDEIELAELPTWWLGFLQDKPEKEQSPVKLEGPVIPEGCRNRTLFELACSLRAKGLPESAIWAALTTTNEERCAPPLDEVELRRTFNSAMKYEPGQMQILPSAKEDFTPAAEKPKVICLDDVEPQEVNWLWYPYIPFGKLTLIQGDPGGGKSMLVLTIAACVSTGRALPGAEPMQPGNVIYQNVEDGLADTIKPRLVKAGANFRRILTIDESEKSLVMDDERLEMVMNDYKPKLLILDPVQSYLGAGTDMHRANEVRPLLKRLALMAEKYDCAVILVMHLSKTSQPHSIYRGLGSIDFPAAARSVLLVGQDPNDKQIRAMVQIKNSLGPQGEGLGFQITDFGLQWTGATTLTDQDILGGAMKQSEDEKNPMKEARQYLIDMLREGPRPAKEILDGVKYSSFSMRTLKRAKAALKIQSFKNSDVWVWAFPPDAEFFEEDIL